jgi:hypothetical protein
VESAGLAGQALNQDLGVFVNQNGHCSYFLETNSRLVYVLGHLLGLAYLTCSRDG